MVINLKTLGLYKKPLIIAAGLMLVILTPFICFQTRSPVLIVSEDAFNSLYGEKRIKTEILLDSLAMFRKIKMVTVANDAGEDIVPHAISEISSKPYCVLFPFRFSRSAKLYKEQNPDIPIILLEGRSTGNVTGIDIKYKTDLENDLKNAGLAASLIAVEGKIAVFLENTIEKQGKDAFLTGLGEEKASEAHFFTSYSSYRQIQDLSCAVLAGTGGEFMEGNTEIPVIFVSWLDPKFFPVNVVMIINDSPLAQAREAVRLFAAGENEGLIRSKIHVQNSKIIDRKLLREIRKIR